MLKATDSENVDFTPAMADVWAVSDLAVSRSGASSCAELTACGVPSVLMPYPYHRDMHQKVNAEQLVEAGAAVLVDESDLEAGQRRADRIVVARIADAGLRHRRRRLGEAVAVVEREAEARLDAPLPVEVERRAAGFKSVIRKRHVALLPPGRVNGGTSQLHNQFVFRGTRWGRPRTDVAHLYLASFSAHPGGGVHGAAGWNAAVSALRRRGKLVRGDAPAGSSA